MEEMNFIEEFFCKKTQAVELKFQLKKEDWKK